MPVTDADRALRRCPSRCGPGRRRAVHGARRHASRQHRPPAPAHRRARRGVSADDAGTGPISAVQGTITTVHQYELPLPRAEVWRLISEVSQYRTWWPWLRSFEGVALAPGEEGCCEVQPPVPYLVRFRVSIEHVEPAVLVRARVGGDVVGEATLTF